ncbi:amidohydrolase family protein [Hyphococcus flavus]|uniref:Amidohydrolase family protein n=1 Tax=Hyphococcus flavus TaxID=1866326 RepID=A0AAE9ZCM7_9PROT|nr:amidohydrolase family protein [Hyphococcus flavus]WDI32314.1 amidohydrolase family protein [Hyphococcus flavus]
MQNVRWTALAVLMLSACSQQNAGQSETATETEQTAESPADATAPSRSTAETGEVAERPPLDPYPSTYERYPGETVLITGAMVLTGTGERIDNGSVLLQDGKIAAVGAADAVAAPDDAATINADGKWVTPGVIDIHSHLGDYPSPSTASTSDGNEVVGPNTAYVWAEHSVWPQDAGFTRALAGGVTSLQVLPGSANLFGGRTTTLKNVPSRSVQGMKFPGAPYGLKMACGENPKRIYGNSGGPGTRMGNFAGYRSAWIEAQGYKKKWDDYWADYEEWQNDDSNDKGDAPESPARDLKLETLAGALRGDIVVNMHCYRGDEMVQVLDLANEFGYKVTTFHHAIEAYKVADYLAENEVCAAVWADWWGFKLEAYDTVSENAALVHAQPGGCAIIHSDDSRGIQRLNQEAAKAMAAGRRIGIDIGPEDAVAWFTANPAKAMGIIDQTGTLEAGKMADVVIWNQNPFSVYARAEQVFIDGALMFDRNDPSLSPRMDFEIGQRDNGFTGGAGQ